MSDAPEDPYTPSAATPEVYQATTETLLDYVLGRPGVAAHLLESLGGLGPLARLSPFVLIERFGITLDEATRVASALELGRRRFVEASDLTTITSSRDIATWAHARIGLLAHEEMWLLGVDGQNGLRGARMLSRGGLHSYALRISDVLRAGLEMAASGFVLVHNYPSGNPAPTKEDVMFTQQLLEAGNLVGMPLLDHIIVTASGQYNSLVVREG